MGGRQPAAHCDLQLRPGHQERICVGIRENWISHFRARQGEISPPKNREIRVGEQLEASSWWPFRRPAHRILRQKKSRTKKNRAEKKISCINTKDEAWWCVETVVSRWWPRACQAVRTRELADFAPEALSGPCAPIRVILRFRQGKMSLKLSRILKRMFSYFLSFSQRVIS